jgi:hypothetical protein
VAHGGSRTFRQYRVVCSSSVRPTGMKDRDAACACVHRPAIQDACRSVISASDRRGTSAISATRRVRSVSELHRVQVSFGLARGVPRANTRAWRTVGGRRLFAERPPSARAASPRGATPGWTRSSGVSPGFPNAQEGARRGPAEHHRRRRRADRRSPGGARPAAVQGDQPAAAELAQHRASGSPGHVDEPPVTGGPRDHRHLLPPR